jgi:hypothetical protein
MSEKFAEYKTQLAAATKLLQAAKDEVVTKLIEGFQSTGKALDQLKEIAPEYNVTELGEWKQFAAKLSLTPAGAKRGRKPKDAGKKASQKSTTGKKPTFSMSEEKAKEYIEFLGKEKTAEEIKKRFKIKNPSPSLKFLAGEGKIKVGRQEGLKKFWVKA